MPKLPADFVKAPVFDNPLRPTTGKLVVADGSKEVVVRFEAAEWTALEAAGATQGLTAEALVKRIVEDWLASGPARPATAASAPPVVDASAPWRSSKLVNQLVSRVQEHLSARFGWVRKILAAAG